MDTPPSPSYAFTYPTRWISARDWIAHSACAENGKSERTASASQHVSLLPARPGDRRRRHNSPPISGALPLIGPFCGLVRCRSFCLSLAMASEVEKEDLHFAFTSNPAKLRHDAHACSVFPRSRRQNSLLLGNQKAASESNNGAPSRHRQECSRGGSSLVESKSPRRVRSPTRMSRAQLGKHLIVSPAVHNTQPKRPMTLEICAWSPVCPDRQNTY